MLQDPAAEIYQFLFEWPHVRLSCNPQTHNFGVKRFRLRCVYNQISSILFPLCSPLLRIRIIYCVLYVTVGKHGDLLTGLLVDVDVTSEMPAVWKKISQ